MMTAPKVMLPVSLSWSMTSEVGGSGMAVEVKLPTSVLLHAVAV